MNKLLTHFIIIFTAIIFSSSATAFQADEKIDFWKQQRKGANIFNRIILAEDLKAAKELGIEFIRLAPDKFITKSRDFLLQNTDNYEKIAPNDFNKLKRILDLCYQNKLPVVLTMLSLPGSRWRQNNNGKDDLRIWQEQKFIASATKFWQELARKLKNHPAIIGYDILNEPHLDKIYGDEIEKISARELKIIQSKQFDFYQTIINGIRKVDQFTPIIIESFNYASPESFKNLKVINDARLLYSFHFYEPYNYTNYASNKGKYSYPGDIAGQYYDIKKLREILEAVEQFQTTNNIPANQILVGEFGANRMSSGISHYFQDLIQIFNENKWHHAFYAFREDTWHGMDYELGSNKLPRNYFEDVELGKKIELKRDSNNQPFLTLKEALK